MAEQLQLHQEEVLALLRQMRQEHYQLQQEQAHNLVMRQRKTILKGFKYDLTDENEYNIHANVVSGIGNNYMLREFSRFVVDEHNAKVLRFLLYYFNNCLLAESVFPDEDYKIHKNILLVGEPGTGKTLLMQVFADYLKATSNDNQFRNISMTQLMNCQKVFGHIDKYTYCELSGSSNKESYDGVDPYNICLNDLGIATEKQKSFGTLLSDVTDEFLFARYEIYQQYGKRYHITSNLTVKELKERFETRLVDRFKSFNVIELHGESRRK
ncbi:MAG: AAA family ATPase [Bacteroides sp.]|nr:AAA family ATPase [Bacteroides sp.]